MITSLIEMLVIKLWSNDHIYNIMNHVINFVGEVMDGNYDVITFTSK